ncbi:MAG: hypothetical protein EU548_00810 [Promethearchaeota archaeon]|nr:MAG: hypothetical protein EU548_00810 [Candidatus Lokiarchaeota archaeon]
MVNSLIEILIKNKGEILDRRMEELLRKEYPFVNNIYLEEIFMKLEAQNIISVFRVSKTKKMIVLNKRNNVISNEIMKDSAY